MTSSCKTPLFLLLLCVLVSPSRAQEINDICARASPLSITTISSGDVVSGTTVNEVGVTADDDVPTALALVRCGEYGTFDITTPGRWYRFLGNGATVKATTCGAEQFRHRISVFVEGGPLAVERQQEDEGACDRLACLMSSIAPDPYCNVDDTTANATNPSVSLEWRTVEKQVYYVLVHDQFNGEHGAFDLQLQDLTPVPANDLCATASLLPSGVTVQATTVGATPASTTSGCGRVTSSTTPSVFYHIPATPEVTNVTLTACSRLSYMDVTVFSKEKTDSCRDLTCFDQDLQLGIPCDVDNTGLGSRVQFLTTPGQDYTVQVQVLNDDTSNNDSGDPDVETAIFAIRMRQREIASLDPNAAQGASNGRRAGMSTLPMLLSLSTMGVAFLALSTYIL